MIDAASETLVPLRDVPRLLPPRPSGKRLHISAVYRWTLRGVRGIRLETTKIGGTTYTSREAIQRFSEGLSGAEPARPIHEAQGRARQQQIERASRRVREELGLGAKPATYTATR